MIGFPIGLLLSLTPLVSWVHETIHVAVYTLQGVDILEVGYSWVYTDRYTFLGLVSAYFIELFLFVFLARRTLRWPVVSYFFLGAAGPVMVMGLDSQDFNSIVHLGYSYDVVDVLNLVWLAYSLAVFLYITWHIIPVLWKEQ